MAQASWWKFWSRAKPAVAKGAATNAMVVYGQGQPVPRITNPAAQLKEGYGENTDVHAAVQLVVGALKLYRIELYKITRSAAQRGATNASVQKQLRTAFVLGGPVRRDALRQQLVRKSVLAPVESHELLDLLAQPNPRQDWHELLEAWAGSYLVTGNGLLHSVAPRDLAKPVQLEVLRPDLTSIIKGNREYPILRYEYGQQKERVEPTEVLHLRTWNPMDDWWGLSPLNPAAKAIDWQNAADDWNLGLVQNGGQKPGAVKVDQTLLPDQRRDLQAWVDEEWAGNGGAGVGRPLLLEGGMSWQDIGMTPAEAAWLDGSRHARRRVCSVYKVAPELLGDSENKTYANVESAHKGLHTHAAMPLMDTLMGKLNGWLVPRFGDGLVLAYSTEDVEALQEDRTALWDRLQAADDLTVNEKRVAKGYEERPEGDVILVPFSMAPLGGSSGGESVQQGATALLTTKAFGLRTFDAKTEYWKAVNVERDKLVPRGRDLVERAFQTERRAVVDALRGASTEVAATLAAQRAVESAGTVWVEALRKLYVGVAGPFAEQVIGQIAKDRGLPELTKAADWEQVVVEHLSNVAGRKVKQISGTTLTQLRSELATGLAEGEGIDLLAKRIDGLYLEKIIPYRSEVIARTEVIAASNLGSRAGAISTGLPLVKEWVSTRDDRTRGQDKGDRFSHIDVDGIKTAMDDPYVVDGEQLLFPGDASLGASAGNLIQCRCTEVYAVADDE